ncbi:MAG: hypothetical protein F4103_06430, partial [Boseongicola sp. SB0673_bin_14]|nr:hypothetical protein [Boseongicola sp. SB0673_bin_14]
MTIDVTPVNDPATGRPTLSGGRQVGDTLAASTADVADAEGLPATLPLQWVRVDADGESNPEDIMGETSATYTLATADIGKRIRVRTDFTDEAGSPETLTSHATGTVRAAGTANTAPAGANVTVLAAAEFAYVFEEGDFGFTDADTGDVLASVTVATLPARGALALGGEALAEGDSVSAGDIAAGRMAYTPADNADRADGYASFTFKVSDGTDESDAANTVTVDTAGRPRILGPPRVGARLVAEPVDIAAAAPAGGYAWQWVRAAGGAETDIPGANAVTYTTTAADAGRRIRLKAGFESPRGRRVTAVSEPHPRSGTMRPASSCPAPVFTGGATLSWMAELSVGLGPDEAFTAGYLGGSVTTSAGVPVSALRDPEYRIHANATTQTVELVETYLGDNPSGAQLNMELSAGMGDNVAGKLVLHVCDRSFPFADAEGAARQGLFTWSHTGLDWRTEGTRTLRFSYDSAAPTLVSTGLSGASLTLTFSENLDAASVPAASAFTVKADGTAADLAASSPVAISGRTVTLTLASAPSAGAAVTVAYEDPGRNQDPLRDLARNAVADIAERTVGSNAAPTATGGTVTTAEDTPYTFKAADFGFADADPGTELASVRIVTLPDKGALALGGEAVAADGTASRADLDSGRLVFTPATGESGDPYASFTFKVSDGVDESDPATTMTIDVTAAAAARLGALSLSEGTLEPAFDAATLSYAAEVASDVEEITVTATADDADATVAFLDGDDAALADADAAEDGHQVALEPGANVIRVRVTLEGAKATTYTVTVTRAGACPAPAYADGVTELLMAEMTAGAGTFTGSVQGIGYGREDEDFGSLEPAGFTAGDNAYTIDFVGDLPDTRDRFAFSLTSEPTPDDVARLTVYVCDTAFALKDRSEGGSHAATHSLFFNESELGLATGDTRTVRVAYDAPGTDATLAALSLGDVALDPAFDAATLDYTASAIFSVDGVTVTATPGDGDATVEWLDGDDAALADADADAEGHQAELDAGENVIKARVTAEDGTTTKTYTVTVTRAAAASADATLSALALSEGTLDPAFDPVIETYAASVANAAVEVTVTATANHAGATVEWLDGDDAALADADDAADGHQARLEEGENVVKMKVTAEDGTTTRTYTVTVTRAATGCAAAALASDGRSAAWTGTVTVGSYASDAGKSTETVVGRGYASGKQSAGSLAPKAFTIGETRYTVNDVFVYATGTWEESRFLYGYDNGTLLFSVDKALHDTQDEAALEASELKLHVCAAGSDSSEDFALSGATYETFGDGIHDYTWSMSGLDWSPPGGTRTVRLSAPPEEARAGPAVAGLPEVSEPAAEDGLYAEDERIEARVAFDQAVVVDVSGGSPVLGLALGGVRRDAAFSGGSGTPALTFSYTVPEGDAGAPLAKAIASGIRLDGATIRGGDGLDAVLAFGEAPGVVAVRVEDDAGVPGSGAGAGDGAWQAGEPVEAALAFAEPVLVDTEEGTPSVRALAGGGERVLEYARGSGTDTPVFAWTPGKGDGPVTSVLVLADSLALNDGAILSTAGLEAVLEHDGAGRSGRSAPALPEISVADAAAAEGGTLAFLVTLDAPAPGKVTVDWATADGTAVAGTDYAAGSGTLTFAAGETEGTVPVAVLDDGRDEDAETMTFTLSNASGATIADGEATGTVHDPGHQPLTGSFSGAPPEHDGTAAFTVTLSFSDEPDGLSYVTVRDSLFTVAGGTVAKARRLAPPSNLRFELTLAPDGDDAVGLELAALPACGEDGSVCTGDG